MSEKGTVILDLDGTLVDSAPDLADALDLLLVEYGHQAIGLEATRRLIGHGISSLVREGFAARGQTLDEDGLTAAAQRFKTLYAERLPNRAKPYPGVPEGLAELRLAGWRLVVCTNKLEAYSRSILEGLDLLQHFSLVAGPDTFGLAKPDPRHLTLTLPAARPSAYAAVMVGDSEIDLEAARAAAIPMVAVTYGYARRPLSALGPQGLAHRFADVPAEVQRIAISPIREKVEP